MAPLRRPRSSAHSEHCDSHVSLSGVVPQRRAAAHPGVHHIPGVDALPALLRIAGRLVLRAVAVLRGDFAPRGLDELRDPVVDLVDVHAGREHHALLTGPQTKDPAILR